MKSRLFTIISVVLMLVLSVPANSFAAPEWDPNKFVNEVPVSAETAAVIDVQTGRILYGKDMNKKMRIASLTKIITAIVAIESGKLEDTVTVSPNAYGVEGSSIYLALGEKQKLKDLVYAIMLRSGNDAATAVAEYVGGGSVKKFTDMMNRKVKELGLTGTHFANPHGLDDDAHYSTAHDMAVLTAYALRNPVFAEIVKTKVKRIPWEGKEWDRVMRNKNKMLFRYQGADGVKTGYTKKAGRCLATSASRDGRQLAVIVLNDGNDWDDSAKLLDYGFSTYDFKSLKANQTISTLPVKYGKLAQAEVVTQADFRYPLRPEERQAVKQEIDLPKQLKAPIQKGQKVGTINFYLNGQKIGSVALVANLSVDEISFMEKIKLLFAGLFTS
ncbi:D-alanyl-D-alanine carboxypeptidase family protein [Effusibacillus dendaii]|uniref:serine-type D-Ala-D-Ala carboxypeptidase n=1 Tax=Effusibacillus dendaii TaxID=2743772 RepID=A0A7I8D6M5_9BACL|nr:D-alanyl-D-alanine carboxypeptidase family protein [Effusibacillus dendaii]BCJ85788.1 D-alanyl-D-alanine carboxypeptidase [Effusibacillus dendaii]